MRWQKGEGSHDSKIFRILNDAGCTQHENLQKRNVDALENDHFISAPSKTNRAVNPAMCKSLQYHAFVRCQKAA